MSFFIGRVCARRTGHFPAGSLKFGRGLGILFLVRTDAGAFFVVFGANALVPGRSGGAMRPQLVQFALVSLVIAMHLHSSAFFLFS